MCSIHIDVSNDFIHNMVLAMVVGVVGECMFPEKRVTRNNTYIIIGPRISLVGYGEMILILCN